MKLYFQMCLAWGFVCSFFLVSTINLNFSNTALEPVSVGMGLGPYPVLKKILNFSGSSAKWLISPFSSGKNISWNYIWSVWTRTKCCNYMAWPFAKLYNLSLWQLKTLIDLIYGFIQHKARCQWPHHQHSLHLLRITDCTRITSGMHPLHQSLHHQLMGHTNFLVLPTQYAA
jgi:hypothetical protein